MIVFASMLGVVCVGAAEPIITLKMAKLELPERRFPIVRDRVVVVASERQNSPAAENFKTMTPEQFALPTNLLLAKPDHEARNLLVISRKHSRENSHSGLWASASFQAGYGQIFLDQNERTYSPTGTGWQEPGCGYLKIRFRF